LHTNAAVELAVDVDVLPRHQPQPQDTEGVEPPPLVLHHAPLDKWPWKMKLKRKSMRRSKLNPRRRKVEEARTTISSKCHCHHHQTS
jgi:hypothetical protein